MAAQEEPGLWDRVKSGVSAAASGISDWWDGPALEEDPNKGSLVRDPKGAVTGTGPLVPEVKPPPVQSPLAEAESGPAPGDVDPELGRTIANKSAEAAKTASAEDKAAVNAELGEMFGGEDRLEEAYKEAIKRLGGEKKFDPKLSRQDWGLFLMDFGMRLAAESGSWDAQLGSAMGKAGSEALTNMQGRQTTEQGKVDDYNQELRKSALGMATSRFDKDNVLWTEKGAFDQRTGRYVRDPGTGGALQPGLTPGSNTRGYQRQISAEALQGAGLPAAVAARIAHSGAPDPAELEFEFGKQFDKMISDLGMIGKVPGTDRKLSQMSPAEQFQARQNWIQQRVRAIYTNMAGPGGGSGPALTQPGPAAEGRQPTSGSR